MKNLSAALAFLLLGIAINAQTVIQPSSAPINEPEKSNSWDLIAVTAGAIALSAFACYLIYLLVSRKRHAMKRKFK